MEKLMLANGIQYDLVVGGAFELGNDKLKITILSGISSFSEIETNFGNELNTQKIKVLDISGETMAVKNDYTYLESIAKQNDYVTGTEEYLDENGETAYRDTKDTVYIIVLSKPDLRAQVKDLQATVDILVLEGLEV